MKGKGAVKNSTAPFLFFMKTLIFSLWGILFLAIPSIAIFVAANSFGKYETIKLVGRLLASFFFYSISTVITLFILAELSKERISMTVIKQVLALITVYFYGFAGYLICSYINGEFYKPWKFTFSNSKKDRSIFNLK